MLRKLNCITCNNTEFKELFQKNNYKFIKCKNCGLVTIDPFPTEKELENYYKSKTISGNYDLNLSIERDRSLQKIINLIIAEKKEGNFIDIGCFDGRLLEFAETAGFTSYGLELQEEAAKKAMQKFPDRIHYGIIEKSQNIFPNKKFSVIVASGVIEHLRSPEYLIEFVDQRLENNGLFVIQTPNENSLLRKLMNKYWFGWSAPEHTFYFSEKSISILLRKFNLSIVQKYKDIKFLRIGYIIEQLSTFGSEIYSLIKPFKNLLPNIIKNKSIPAYGGEMIILIKRKTK